MEFTVFVVTCGLYMALIFILIGVILGDFLHHISGDFCDFMDYRRNRSIDRSEEVDK